MRTAYGRVDATAKLVVTLLQCDADNGEPRDAANCAIAVAAKRQHPFEEFILYRWIAYGKFNGSKRQTRWQTTPNIRAVLVAYDINSTTTHSRIPPEGVVLVFKPPRASLRIKYLKSKKRKAAAKASREKHRGQPRRAYRAPDPWSLAGVRWGTRLKT